MTSEAVTVAMFDDPSACVVPVSVIVDRKHVTAIMKAYVDLPGDARIDILVDDKVVAAGWSPRGKHGHTTNLRFVRAPNGVYALYEFRVTAKVVPDGTNSNELVFSPDDKLLLGFISDKSVTFSTEPDIMREPSISASYRMYMPTDDSMLSKRYYYERVPAEDVTITIRRQTLCVASWSKSALASDGSTVSLAEKTMPVVSFRAAHISSS
jgi:hypothetical protein